MTFLEALYGSQYYEIHQKGRDGNKGRLNGNLFLSALIILFVLAVLMICISFVPGFNESMTKGLRNIFGYSTGKSIGKLLAIPAFAIIYFIVLKTVGTETNFKNKVDAFMQYPDNVKKKSNAKLLIPFFILGVIVFGLAFSKL
jgi:NADH:ubiquinone oxidoreductase subunit 6 (subunit J)